MNKNRYCRLAFCLLLATLSLEVSAQQRGDRKAEIDKTLIKRVQEQEEQIKKRMAELLDRKAVLLAEKAKHEKALADLYHEQDKKRVSLDAFPEVIKKLQSQRVELMIDLAGMEARREAVLKMMKKVEVDSNDIMKQLEALLKNEEEVLRRAELRFQSGDETELDLKKAKSRLLELRIRMAEAKQPAGNTPFYQDELLKASLERAEKSARLEKVESLLDSFTSSRNLLNQTDQRQQKLNMTLESVDQLEADLRALELNLKQREGYIENLKKQLGSGR